MFDFFKRPPVCRPVTPLELETAVQGAAVKAWTMGLTDMDASFDAIGVDSFDLVELHLQLEEDLDIHIPDYIMEDCYGNTDEESLRKLAFRLRPLLGIA